MRPNYPGAIRFPRGTTPSTMARITNFCSRAQATSRKVFESEQSIPSRGCLFGEATAFSVRWSRVGGSMGLEVNEISFIPQRFNRIEPRCPTGGVEPEEYSY